MQLIFFVPVKVVIMFLALHIFIRLIFFNLYLFVSWEWLGDNIHIFFSDIIYTGFSDMSLYWLQWSYPQFNPI